MPLASGTRIGSFEILGAIGAGGMGEVYRARDSKLKREVALKVLPEGFSRDPERMARFQREAELLASLNHPNIAHIYGVEDRALVMELVEGETLPSPLPIDVALDYARQIAEALEYAHERGVIHRDLKPANVKVTPDGVVKLLDFGLAKAIEDPTGASDNPTNSPTLTLGATRVGVIMGTAAYMSPEQASGKTADRRADIWSFGAVFYEMLSGKRAFAGESVSDTLATLLKLDPDWNALPGNTPAVIRKLVQRCLTKDRKQRLQAIGEARITLESPAIEEAAPSSTPSHSRLGMLGWIVAAAMLVALGAALWTLWPRTAERPLVRLDVDLGPDVSLPPTGGTSIILSPDGTRLVYLSGTPPKLFVRRLDQAKATELPGTDNAVGPFFSPDGQWVGFYTKGKLNKISVEGGAVVPIAELTNFAGGTWGEDGSIVAGVALRKGLVRIAAGGGASVDVTELANGEIVQGNPQILPGGQAILFGTVGGQGVPTIEVVSLADHHRKVLVKGLSGRYLATDNGRGHLIYRTGATLFAVPFDLERLETRGTALPILDDLRENNSIGYSVFDVSSAPSGSGTLVYRKGSASAGSTSTIQWLDANGNKQALLKQPGSYSSPRLSPDGKRLAFQTGQPPNQDIWVYDIQRDAPTRLTSGIIALGPVWSPNSRYLVFAVLGRGVFWVRADGASQPQPLMESKSLLSPASFGKDGARMAYYEIQASPQIWTVPIEESNGQLKAGKPEQFLKSQFLDVDPTFSPDGRWLAYSSGESGNPDVYVRPFPSPVSGQGGKWPISNGGGSNPSWSPNGRELFYRSGDQIMVVTYTTTGGAFVADKPRLWGKLGGATGFDLAPDGKRFAVVTPVAAQEAPQQDHQVVFQFNFFDELRRRVPLGK